MATDGALPVSPGYGVGVLRVDLDAVVGNWRLLAARHPAGPVAGVVKADGYGLGAGPVARALRDAGCRHFFVAQLGEGLALRDAVGRGPEIAVLNGFPPGADGGSRLVPVLNALPDLDAHAAAGRARGAPVPAILHLDTGMSRLGLDAAEAEALAADHARLEGLALLRTMTHLACADLPDHPLNARQADRYAALRARLPPLPGSIANSSGLFLGPRFGSDLARPGCALYGLNPTPGRPNPMRAAVALAAPILQVRAVAAGDGVGYGAAWVAARPSRVATVAAGYADGYLRAFSGQAVGRLDGRSVALIGRVSMDLLTFDVTDHPGARPGDMIELIGPHATPDALAAAAGTIGYEVLTRLGARLRRHHLPAAARAA